MKDDAMSGFDPNWLALREGADHKARDKALLLKVAQKVGRRDGVSIVDLGCGTGSNLRAIAPALAQDWQSWTLVDHDPKLLEAAQETLEEWADDSEAFGEELILMKGEKRITVDLRHVDLATDFERVLDWRPDMITAAALFDLISEEWMIAFAIGLARREIAFYTALTYDGREEWTPPHPLDARVKAAFDAHQGRDKGFGPAAGPGATSALKRAFSAAGYVVETGDSPWRLGAGDGALIGELASGIAAAAAETGDVSEAQAQEWLAAHGAGASCLIGHLDLFARPA
jgi:SAM-dependent methyltransferase